MQPRQEEFDRLNAQWGLTAFKLSPFRIDLHAHRWGEVVRTSAEYFRNLRETVRSDYEIAFDAHAKIFEPKQAIQLGNALAPYDPLFFEEPIRPENIEAMGEVNRETACTVATGFARTPLELALGMAGTGLFASIYHPVGIAWLVRNAKNRGKALGINGV